MFSLKKRFEQICGNIFAVDWLERHLKQQIILLHKNKKKKKKKKRGREREEREKKQKKRGEKEEEVDAKRGSI